MHDRPTLPLVGPHAGRFGWLAAAVLLLPASGCIGRDVLLGDYTDTDMGTGTGTDTEPGADSASSGEPTCTEDCDPDFAVSYLSAVNFHWRAVHLLGDTTCDGPACPPTVSPPPVEGMPLEPCAQTEAALASAVGAAEYCRLAPIGVSTFGLDLAFETPVDRSSFERLRPSPEDETTEEAYLWYTDVVELRGPGTALRGDYRAGAGPDDSDLLTAVVNETCAARLTAQGIPFTEAQLETLCVGTWDDGGVLRPLRMDPAMVFSPYGGSLSTRSEWSCDTPENGPDTCCSACDLELGPNVARYGVSGAGTRRNPNEGTALACDPSGDALVDCRDLELQVERGDELPYTYAWDGAPQAWPLPRYDKLRETHPDQRPAGLELAGASCLGASDCAVGQDCIGTNAAGEACHAGEDCMDRTCRAEWFGDCQVTTGASGWCVDRRFYTRGAGACLATSADFADGMAGDRLAQCDANGDGSLSSTECCDPALGGGAGCDPLYQPNLDAVARYDRSSMLVPQAACVCEAGQPASCAETIEAWCEAPVGSESDPGPASAPGAYALPLVERQGGVRWDEERGVLDVRLAVFGQVPRAEVEACAENRGLIGGRSVADGWQANVANAPQRLADHDLALCSGSTYRVVLAESAAEHHVRSAGQGTLDGKSEHVFETPQLRIGPNSLFPSDNLNIDSCASFRLSLSNRHDPSLANLRKLQLREGAPDGPLAAGGPGCDPDASPAEVAAGAIPCLTFDAKNDPYGELRFFVDESIHGQVLQTGSTYFVVLPGLASIEQMADAEAYAAAFHDVCGMPLIVGESAEELALWEQSFTVDEPCQ